MGAVDGHPRVDLLLPGPGGNGGTGQASGPYHDGVTRVRCGWDKMKRAMGPLLPEAATGVVTPESPTLRQPATRNVGVGYGGERERGRVTPDRGGAERNGVPNRDYEMNSRSFLTSSQPQRTDGVNFQDTPGEHRSQNGWVAPLSSELRHCTAYPPPHHRGERKPLGLNP